MRSILRLGSFGQEVCELQGLLNFRLTGAPKLDVDGAFGNRTSQKVREYQGKVRLTVDGVVGPNTWHALVGGSGWASGAPAGGPTVPPPPSSSADTGLPAVQTEAMPPSIGANPGSEEAARQKIAEVALKELATYRWNPSEKPGPDNPRIAGKLLADRTTRARQGGKHIAEIFQIAGGPAPTRCQTLSEAAEKMYQRSYTASERNNTDIVSWCGIFSLYCLKVAGLKLSGWPFKYTIGKPKATDEMRIKGQSEAPQVGDIGIVEPSGLNHHFVVVSVDGGIRTVDGNSGMLMEICENNRTLAAIKGKQGYFITPIWDRVL